MLVVLVHVLVSKGEGAVTEGCTVDMTYYCKQTETEYPNGDR